MKERPILFSAPMVRAILAGTKTQTRRVVKYSIKGPSEPMDTFDWYDKTGKWVGAHGRGYPFKKTNAALLCPYGQPGDRLWVRETWAPRTLGAWPLMDQHMKPIYRASEDRPEWKRIWKPSIHMPRWASRITLEVTGVRVERLQDISEADAVAEGIDRSPSMGKPGAFQWCDYRIPNDPAEWFNSPIRSYQSLWEQINGYGSWDANPWVWVLELKRLEGGAA